MTTVFCKNSCLITQKSCRVKTNEQTAVSLFFLGNWNLNIKTHHRVGFYI